MGKFSRDKGAREERSIVNAWQAIGYAAERVPLSGAAGGRFSGDVDIPILNVNRKFEAKLRADGFKQIYSWLGEHFGLFLRADNKPRLVVLRELDFQALCMAAERKGIAKCTMLRTSFFQSGWRKPTTPKSCWRNSNGAGQNTALLGIEYVICVTMLYRLIRWLLNIAVPTISR